MANPACVDGIPTASARSRRGGRPQLSAVWRVARAGALVFTVVLSALHVVGCSGFWSSGGRTIVVDVRLVDHQLTFTFAEGCRIGYLRLSAVNADGFVVAPPLWWIRAPASEDPHVDVITAGQPPAGFEEVTDNLQPDLPSTLDLTVRSGFTFAGDFDTASLADGAAHQVELLPVMNELSPARSNGC